MIHGNGWDVLDCVTPPTPPEVGVVIPYFDAQRQLDLVLAGLDLQTLPPVDVVVADDGSPVPPIVPPWVRVVSQPDAGFRAAAARNLGAAAVRGDVLCFLDADTVPEPAYLERISRLPALAPDALVVGRRRHADLAGWTPSRVRTWFAGGEAPAELPEPRWLADGYRASRNLLRADERSYRFVISAVLACTRALFDEVGGFDETFIRYGGEDWEFANRAWIAGAVFAHEPAAVAWHDGPDWAGRNLDLPAARAQKRDEAETLRRLIPEPGTFAEVYATDAARTIAEVGALLGDFEIDCGIWVSGPAATAVSRAFGGDGRVRVGAPGKWLLARCRSRATPSGLLDVRSLRRPRKHG